MGRRNHASGELRWMVLPAIGLFVDVTRSSQRPVIVTVVFVSTEYVWIPLLMVSVWDVPLDGNNSKPAKIMAPMALEFTHGATRATRLKTRNGKISIRQPGLGPDMRKYMEIKPDNIPFSIQLTPPVPVVRRVKIAAAENAYRKALSLTTRIDDRRQRHQIFVRFHVRIATLTRITVTQNHVRVARGALAF